MTSDGSPEDLRPYGLGSDGLRPYRLGSDALGPYRRDPEDLRPYRLDVPQADLDDLHDRLDRTRWPDELPGVGRAYGMPRGELRALAHYWRHSYDWRAAEARLNEWPQFTTVIDGQRLHFAHIRSPEPDATPLLITHGWPGSIAEFTRVAGPLTDPRAHGADPADAFHLVLPHIPGFGLSGPTTQAGWEYGRVAAAFAELMRRLGYGAYGVQGGDWGPPSPVNSAAPGPRSSASTSTCCPVPQPTTSPLPPNSPHSTPPNAPAPSPPGNASGTGPANARATPTSSPPARRPSPTRSPTHPWANSPGSPRSSLSGPTHTQNRPSTATSCSPT